MNYQGVMAMAKSIKNEIKTVEIRRSIEIQYLCNDCGMSFSAKMAREVHGKAIHRRAAKVETIRV